MTEGQKKMLVRKSERERRGRREVRIWGEEMG